MMAFEADRITGLVLTDEVVRPELNVVLEEQNMRVANNPSSRLAEQMDAALYLNHPYGRPVIGWRPEIEALDRDDALAFYRRFYTPNNAIVVVAGDVTAEEVKADAEETYGKIAPRAQIAPRQRPKEPAQEAPRTVTLADARVEQPSINRYYLVPSRTTAKPGESEALEVLAHVLGSGSNSRLYRALVVEQGIALNAGAYYSGTALDYGKFGVYGSPKPGKTLARRRSGDRRCARRRQRARRHRRRTRSRQEPADRGRRLCAGQSGDAGALVRRGARDRRDRRHGPRTGPKAFAP